MILTRPRYLLHPLLLIMLQWSSPCVCIPLHLPLRIACLRWSIIARVAWDIHGFLAHRRLPRTSLAAKLRALVMTPHGFKGLILQGGGFKFWGNIRRILPTHVNIRKRWQVWDEVLSLRLSRSLKFKLQSRQHRKMVRVNVKTAINSALSNHFNSNGIVFTYGTMLTSLGTKNNKNHNVVLSCRQLVRTFSFTVIVLNL